MSRFVLTAQLQLQAPSNVSQVVRQIQSQLNNVNVNVQVQNAPQARRQIQQVTQATSQAANAAERMGRAFAVSVRRFAAFSIATRAVGLFTSTLSDAVQTAIDFERQLVKVSQVTGKSVGQLRDLTDEITRLSTGLGVSSNSLLEVSTILAQAGLSANDTKVALNSLAKAALAPNFDSITETAEGAIAILAQFGKGVNALEGQLGSINAVAGAFAVEASDLIDVIRRTGGVFKSSGGDLNELLALFTSVRATTRESAESIGTGLRTIFTRIQRPKTIEYLKQFGIELVDLEGKFVGPFEAVRRLSSALSGLGEGDITFIQIAEELGGFRQIGKVLPLLQQFQTAQAALNVANKAGNSLTQDAASAQAALAIRILKVKEEFLALVRSVTETSTFQIMANTALNLASALIKLSDSIKPLLPLLGAVAAFKIAKGFGTFAGGIMGGLSSTRTFNRGGKVHHFARGGMVPGTGNRDTVPAMLSPGEFVIRKSSVNKLGASNLAAMNENRYAKGGRAIVGATQKLKSTQKRDGKYGANKSVAGSGGIQFDVNDGQVGAFVLTPPKGTEGGYTATQPYSFILPPNSRYTRLAALQAGLSAEDVQGGINATINPATYPVFYPGMEEGKRNLQNNAKYAAAAHKGFLDGISSGVNSTVQSVASQGLLDLPPALSTNENLMKGIIGKIQSDGQVRSTIEGYLFEAMISAFTGATAAGGRANFDFPRSAISQNKDKLATLFGSPNGINKLIKAEAKRGYGEVGGNIQRKLANDIIGGYKGGVTLKTTGLRKGFATGGGVGTDTVPALLTPGEFVVNKASAQRIGYGNLHKMNKVGKYAKGGIVQRFAEGGTAMPDARARYSRGFVGTGGLDSSQSFVPLNMLAQQAGALAQAQQVLTQATQQTSQAQQQQTRSARDVASQSKMLASSLAFGAVGMLQTFLPAIDENSSTVLKLTHTLLGFASTVTGAVLALQAFGVQLQASTIMNFLSGKGLDTQGVFSFFRNLGANKGLSGGLTVATQAVAKFLGPIAGATAAFFAIQAAGKSLIETFNNYEARLKKATEGGNVQEAKKIGGEQQRANRDVNIAAGATAGGIIGSFFGPIGTAAGAAIGAAIGGSLSDTVKYAEEAAATQAALSKSQQTLTKASEDASKALTNFENGSISAADYLKSTSSATAAVVESRSQAEKINATGDGNRDTGLTGGIRNVVTLGGLLGETTGQRDKRITAEQENSRKQVNKQEQDAINVAQPALNAMAKSVAMTGGSFDDLMTKIKETDPNLYDILIRQGTKPLIDNFINLEKEVKRTKAALEATNLGLRGAQATSTAMSASMEKFASGLEVGGNSFVTNTQFLSEAMTSAAQAMNPEDLKSAISDVSKNLTSMGVSPAFVSKFEGNTNALIQAQQNYGKAFDNIIAESKKSGKIFSADTLKERFASELGNMMGPGVSEDAKKNLRAMIEGMKLTPDEVNEIMSGNYQVFGDKLSEAGKKQFEEIMKIAQERQKAEQVLINLTKQRIEAERNFVQAQKEAFDLQLEGREIQGKYGGQAVTIQERRQNVLNKANAGSGFAGIGNLQTGSAAELRLRNQQIRAGFSQQEAKRSQQNGMAGASGVQSDATQNNLAQAQKDQVQTIRDLIKLEEENLKLIQEKNKLEKQSLESLINGDIEKFFEQQAAVGATAAIATGNQSLMGQFGASALAGAYSDIQRQQEAGVQEIYGQRIAGQGGLAERAGGAALAARGIQNPAMAQLLAGTTAAEESSRARLRELGGVLGETGQLGADMAMMQLQTAEINVSSANIKLQDITDRGNQAAQVAGMYRGGVVYANRGMFVPRGTDTVPAMLTPGEFVVNRNAVNRGNNLKILQAMNSGRAAIANSSSNRGSYYSKGGKAQYLANGGIAQGGSLGSLDPKVLTDFSNALNNFNTELSKNITNLQNTKFNVTVDATNITVNLTGTSFLSNLKDQVKQELFSEIGSQISKYRVGGGGKLIKSEGILNNYT